MKGEHDLTADRIREIAIYDPDSGTLTATAARMRYVKEGNIIGSLRADGYLDATVDGRQYLVHRLVWLWTFGEWPSYVIDHIDGDKSNNRISNLRDVSRAVNQQNIRVPYKSSSTNTLGVHWNKRDKRWYAVITINRKKKHLGIFRSRDDALTAFLVAKRQLHEGCTI